MAHEFIALVSKQKFLKKLGAHVKMLRQKSGLTQAALSSRMDKDLQSLQRVERGAINPSIFYLHELAQALEIELHELLKFE